MQNKRIAFLAILLVIASAANWVYFDKVRRLNNTIAQQEIIIQEYESAIEEIVIMIEDLKTEADIAKEAHHG